MTKISLKQLADLAIGTPEVGAVNFNALHTLLHSMLGHMKLSDTDVNFDDDDRTFLKPTAINSAEVIDTSKLTEKNVKGDPKEFRVGTSHSARSKDSGYGQSPYHHLEAKVQQLDQQLELLNELPSSRDILKLMGQENSQEAESRLPLQQLWQNIKLTKRVSGTEDGIEQLNVYMNEMMGMFKGVEANLRRVQKKLGEKFDGIEDVVSKLADIELQTAALNENMEISSQELQRKVSWSALDAGFKGENDELKRLQSITSAPGRRSESISLPASLHPSRTLSTSTDRISRSSQKHRKLGKKFRKYRSTEDEEYRRDKKDSQFDEMQKGGRKKKHDTNKIIEEGDTRKSSTAGDDVNFESSDSEYYSDGEESGQDRKIVKEKGKLAVDGKRDAGSKSDNSSIDERDVRVLGEDGEWKDKSKDRRSKKESGVKESDKQKKAMGVEKDDKSKTDGLKRADRGSSQTADKDGEKADEDKFQKDKPYEVGRSCGRTISGMHTTLEEKDKVRESLSEKESYSRDSSVDRKGGEKRKEKKHTEADNMERFEKMYEPTIVISEESTSEPRAYMNQATSISSSMLAYPSDEIINTLNSLGLVPKNIEDMEKRIRALESRDPSSDSQLNGVIVAKIEALENDNAKLKDEMDKLINALVNDPSVILKEITFIKDMLADNKRDADSTFSEMHEEVLNLASVTADLLKDGQDSIKKFDLINRRLVELQENKADNDYLMEQIDVKADKQDLDSKVDTMVFVETTKTFNDTIADLLDKLAVQEKEWRATIDKITAEIDSKMDRNELQNLKNWLENRLKSLNAKMHKVNSVEDEAAGIRRQLLQRFNCISCDRPIDMAPSGPIPSIPFQGGLPPTKSPRPYTTFELDSIRQHARNLLQTGDVADTYVTDRACGGSYTITYPSKRVTKTAISTLFRDDGSCMVKPMYKDELEIMGSDGRVYHGRYDTDMKLPNVMTNYTQRPKSAPGEKTPSTSPPLFHSPHPPTPSHPLIQCSDSQNVEVILPLSR